ncbi:MAG: hypothetical protein IRY94_21180 [Rhodospirillaceae bacterium]|nr:hypothetical protein [Rhodospirillaceae bacterium]
MGNDRPSVSPYLLRPLRSRQEAERDRQTLHDRLVAGLEVHGWRVVEDARSTKYTVLTRDGGRGGFYYVGKAGALRVGRTVAESRPVPAALRARLLEVE